MKGKKVSEAHHLFLVTRGCRFLVCAGGRSEQRAGCPLCPPSSVGEGSGHLLCPWHTRVMSTSRLALRGDKENSGLDLGEAARLVAAGKLPGTTFLPAQPSHLQGSV